MLYFLFVLFVGLLVGWLFMSCRVLTQSQVALPLRWGHPIEIGTDTSTHKPIYLLYGPGVHFVPWLPKWFDGQCPWDLAVFSSKMFSFHYEGKPEHEVFSSDHQLLLVKISGNVRFPYLESDSLALILKSEVPLDEPGLEAWLEREIVSGLRDIMAGFTLEQSIERSNLTAIAEAAKKFFLRPDGLFAKSGICGNNPTNFDEGTGEVILRVEQVNPTPEVQQSLQSVVMAKYGAQAARGEAQKEGILAGDPIRNAMVEWVDDHKLAGESREQAAERLQKVPAGAKESPYAAHERTVKDLILMKNGDLKVAQNLYGSPDGTPLPASLQYFSAGGGGGVGVFADNRGKGGGKGRSGKKPWEMSPSEAADAIIEREGGKEEK